MAGRDLFSRPVSYEEYTRVTPLSSLGGQITDEYTSGGLAGELDMDPSWLDVFDNPGDSDSMPPQI